MGIEKDCLYLTIIATFLVLYILSCKLLFWELIKQKKYFIETLGHDFRVSVLAQMRGLDFIIKSTNLNSEQHTLLTEIDKSCKYTLDMVSMLLNIYKIENGNKTLNLENFSLTLVFNNILKEFSEMINEKKLHFSFNINNSMITADKNTFTKALNTIFFTVILYSKSGSTINIKLDTQMNKIKLNINYLGNPISYEEYNRMHSKNSYFSTVGHGIQMYFCKKILDLHKGKIKFYTDESGNINYFEILMPTNIKYRPLLRLQSLQNLILRG